jgi:uncharacterized protein (DUF58 family)
VIVPAARLLAWVSILGPPLAVLGTASPEAAAASGVVGAAFLVMTLADALLAPRRIRALGATLPELVRLTIGREGRIEIDLANPDQRVRRVRVGLALPDGLESPVDSLAAALPPSTPRSRLFWACTPRRRGSYRISRCFVETPSPLGFWDARRAIESRTEIRVYPDLLAEGRSVAAIFLHRGAAGAHAQRQVGKGRDFEKLREYIPGDSYDEIHWKATAKRGRPVTKVFQIEKTQEVYVAIDSSRLSGRAVGTPPVASLERFINAALVLALAAERQGDRFGLLAFSDRIRSFVRARSGPAHFGACREALYALQPQILTPDFEEVATFVRLRLRRRALLVFLTDLDDPVLAESFVKSMDLICRQHLVVVGMLRGPDVRPLFSDEAVAAPEDLYRKLGGHILWRSLAEVSRLLQRRGVGLSLLDSASLSADLVSRYMTIKQRQIL